MTDDATSLGRPGRIRFRRPSRHPDPYGRVQLIHPGEHLLSGKPADWELEAELEHIDRLLCEAEPDGVAEAMLLEQRREVAAELVGRQPLTYQRARSPFDLRHAVEEIKQRADLLAIFGSRCPQHVSCARSTGRVVHILCPFHADRKPSLAIYREEAQWWCFGCQRGGDAIAAVELLDGLGFVEAVLRLAAEFGIRVPKQSHGVVVGSNRRHGRRPQPSQRSRVITVGIP